MAEFAARSSSALFYLGEDVTSIGTAGWVGQITARVGCLERTLTQRPSGDDEEFHPLTAREWQIAQQIADGLENNEIAERLLLSRATVATHVAKILKKLRHRSRVQVAVWVTERRLRSSSRTRA